LIEPQRIHEGLDLTVFELPPKWAVIWERHNRIIFFGSCIQNRFEHTLSAAQPALLLKKEDLSFHMNLPGEEFARGTAPWVSSDEFVLVARFIAKAARAAKITMLRQ